MVIKKIFQKETIGSDTIFVSMDNTILTGFIKANESASFILSCLETEISYDELVRKVQTKYNISEEQAYNAVEKIVAQLREGNFLE